MNKGYSLIELLLAIIVISVISWATLAIIDNFFININYPKYLIIGAIIFIFLIFLLFFEKNWLQRIQEIIKKDK
tara:strand:+ start:453 stop:674 length:222 start_codon:yes stop_codon:yes gene_type:complete